MPKQEMGPQEPEEASREFSPAELTKLQEVLETKVATVIEKFSDDVEGLEKKGKTFDDSVEKYRADADGKIDLWDLDLRVLNDKQLYKNLLYSLGLHKSDYDAEGANVALNSIATRRAMEKDERLKTIVTAIIEGAEKADAKKIESGRYKTTDKQAQQGAFLKKEILY